MYKINLPFSFLAIGLLSLIGCGLPSSNNSGVSLSIDDEDFQEISDLQDRRDTKSLLTYFSENQNNRYLAARAFGSFQDETAIDSLAKLLAEDPSEEVRAVAAYALGQQKKPAAANPIVSQFGKEKSREVQAAMLEAVGKCGNMEHLENIAGVKTYRLSDTALLLGQSRSIYRFGLRGITSEVGTQKMVDYAVNPEIPAEVRLYAAAYLQRTKDIDLKDNEQGLAATLEKDEDPKVRMYLALALGKTPGLIAQDALINAYKSESDYRVKISILKALAKFPYEVTRELIIAALKDKSPHVAFQAANILKEVGNEADTPLYLKEAEATDQWRVRTELFAAILANTPLLKSKPSNFFSRQIIKQYNESNNPYEKGALLKALAEYPPNFRFVRDITFSVKDTVQQTYGIEALAAIRQNEKFNQIYRTNGYLVRKEFAKIFADAITSGDVTMIGTAADVIKNPALNYDKYYKDYTFIEETLKRLNLPKDMETYYALQKALAFLKGQETPETEKPKFNNPIDWRTIEGMGDTIVAKVSTAKGEFEIELYPELAPGSVVNFVKLTNEGFYNGKNFHRVVPNFVAQGGCPRGDGWGSLDYSIRSELGPSYYDSEGWFGMASAGNDTEGTQWFITHSPTPHLDGRYTIFGKVVRGASVVHMLNIGDVISSVSVGQ